jgi:hypothetical protein
MKSYFDRVLTYSFPLVPFILCVWVALYMCIHVWVFAYCSQDLIIRNKYMTFKEKVGDEVFEKQKMKRSTNQVSSVWNLLLFPIPPFLQHFFLLLKSRFYRSKKSNYFMSNHETYLGLRM